MNGRREVVGPEHPTGILNFANSVLGQKTGLVRNGDEPHGRISAKVYNSTNKRHLTWMVMPYFDKMDPWKLGQVLRWTEMNSSPIFGRLSEETTPKEWNHPIFKGANKNWEEQFWATCDISSKHWLLPEMLILPRPLSNAQPPRKLSENL